MNGDMMVRRFVSPTVRIPTVNIRASSIRGALIRAALPAVAGALLLAGCGASGGTAATASASASATATAGLSTFETCLKQHGAKVTPGQFGARPTGSPRARPTGSARPSFAGGDSTAFKACAKYAPAGFGAGGGQAISSSALAAFKSCLSSNGVKVTGSTAAAVLSELRNSTGKTATAVSTCEVLIRPAASPTPSA